MKATAKTTTSKQTITVRNRGTPVEIGGKTYVLPPITLAAIEKRGQLVAQLIEGKLAPMQLGVVSELVTESLARNYAGIDREEIANNIDIVSMNELMSALMTTDPTKLVRELEVDNAATPA